MKSNTRHLSVCPLCDGKGERTFSSLKSGPETIACDVCDRTGNADFLVSPEAPMTLIEYIRASRSKIREICSDLQSKIAEVNRVAGADVAAIFMYAPDGSLAEEADDFLCIILSDDIGDDPVS